MEDLNEVLKAYFIDLGVELTEDQIQGLMDHLDNTGYKIVDLINNSRHSN